MDRRRNRLPLWVTLSAALFGCGADALSPCVPGQSAACTCDAGAEGSRLCQDDGHYGDCQCGGELPGAGGGPLSDVSASIGQWCGQGDGLETWLVVTPRPSTCEEHADSVGALGDRDGLAFRVDGTLGADDEQRYETVARRCRRGNCGDYPAQLTLSDVVDGRGGRGEYSLVLSDGSTDAGRFDAKWCTWERWVPSPPPEQLVRGLRIDDIAFYQAVQVPLVVAGESVVRANAPVIADRAGVMRIALGADAAWDARDFRVRLTLQQPDGEVSRLEVEADEVPDPDEADPNSTFNFELTADEVRTGTGYVVEVLEVEACLEAAGSNEAARWPRNGRDSLPAEATGQLAITLVPVSYTAGGGAVPSLTPAFVSVMEQALATQLPVSGVRLTVREPVAFDAIIEPTCADLQSCGWNDLLTALVDLRVDDGAPPDEYYYGMVMPGADLDSYCGGNCILGVGAVTGLGDELLRVATGIGFSNVVTDRSSTLTTIVHELAHTLGRAHSPCGDPEQVDPDFPYPGGELGSWGYDARSDEYKDPSTHSDIMGYCPPAWVSDYTFDGIAQRLLAIEAQQPVLSAADEVQPFVSGGGVTRFGRPVPTSAVGTMLQGAAMQPAMVVDAAGTPVAMVPVRGLPLPDTGSTFWLMPRPQPDWARLHLPDGDEVDLRARVAAPRLRRLAGR